MYLSDRLKKLEQQTATAEHSTILINVLDDGMVGVYSDSDGKKTLMTEPEHEQWAKRFNKSNNKANVNVDIGKWDE